MSRRGPIAPKAALSARVNACFPALVAAALQLQGSALATEPVQVQDHGDGRHTLSAVVQDTNDPADGLAAITPEAVRLCGARQPHFGRYRFEALAPLAGSGAPGGESLLYEQDITCHDAPQEMSMTIAAPVPPAPDSPPDEDDAATIHAHTRAYFLAKESADADAAYRLLSTEMASYATPREWEESRASVNAQMGPGAQTNLLRLTWYDNPAGAPTPGRYAAVDYEVTYPSRGFTCGYVMWLRQADGGYLLVREEEGQATPDIVADLPPEQIAAIRAQLHCRDQGTQPAP